MVPETKYGFVGIGRTACFQTAAGQGKDISSVIEYTHSDRLLKHSNAQQKRTHMVSWTWNYMVD